MMSVREQARLFLSYQRYAMFPFLVFAPHKFLRFSGLFFIAFLLQIQVPIFASENFWEED